MASEGEPAGGEEAAPEGDEASAARAAARTAAEGLEEEGDGLEELPVTPLGLDPVLVPAQKQTLLEDVNSWFALAAAQDAQTACCSQHVAAQQFSIVDAT